MRILVLQTVDFERFLSASRAVMGRYPDACLVGLTKDADLRKANETGYFVEVHAMPSNIDQFISLTICNTSINLCVVPFEDRLGVRYWKFRWLPIKLGSPTVASYNVYGKLREWDRHIWIFNSLLICTVVRGIHALARSAWSYSRRWLDVLGVFGLGWLALTLCLLKRLGLVISDQTMITSLPPGRRKVVLFIPSLGMGGAQRQLAYYLEHIDRSKWDPEVITLETPDKFFEPMIRALAIPITYLDAYRTYRMVGIILQLNRHLRTNRYFVLHSWLHYAVNLGAIAGCLANVSIIIGSLRSENPARFPWFYPKWQRGLDILTVPLQSLLIANSNAVREENRRWAFIPKQKIITVFNGISMQEVPSLDDVQEVTLRSDLHLPTNVLLVGIVGRLSPEKDHASFLRAVRLVADACSAVHFMIVGDGPLRAWIASEIEKLGLRGRVMMLGQRNDAPTLIRLLDVLVLTSSSEGFPNVLLEAALMRTSVVTTAAGGASEVVLNKKTGFVVPCGDAKAIANRVMELLNDRELRRRFADAARERVEMYFAAHKIALAIQETYDMWNGRSRTHVATASIPCL